MWSRSHDHLVAGDVRHVGPSGRMRVGILDLRSALRRVAGMVFETVEVLVALAACGAAVWFLFFHAQGAGVGVHGFGIDDGEGAVVVVFEFLGVVTVLDVELV